MIKKFTKNYFKKFVVFGVVGVISTGIDWGMFNLFYFIGISFILSRIFSAIISTIFNFSVNRNITFSARGNCVKKQAIKWLIVYSLGTLANIGIGKLFLIFFGENTLNANIAYFLGLAVSIPINFFGSLLWVFKKSKKQKRKREREKFKLEMEEDHMEKLYLSKNPFVRYIHNKRLDKIVELITKIKDGKRKLKILDAGCGEGQLLERLFKRILNYGPLELYGADITEIAIKKAKQRVKNAKFSLQNLGKLKYKNNYFDIIVCTEVIEHIPNYKRVIKEIKRILKKGGILIISFPNEPLWTISRFLLGRRPIKVPDHINSFSPKQIKKEVKMQFIKKRNIPFGFPSFLALTRILVFKKEN